MSTFRSTLPIAIVLAMAATLPAQQPTQQAAAASMAGMRGALGVDITDLEGKYVKLAEAMASKYDYRPAAGVRSTAEVFAHVAAANFMIPGFWGVKPPAGVDVNAVSKLTDKTQIIDALRKSFAHVRDALGAVPESELDRPIKIFGQDATVRRGQILIVNHMHEHLGQSIAYARANGIVPPWSASGGGN